MKPNIDRKLIIPAVVAVVIILCVVLINVSVSLKKRHAGLMAQQKELMQLREEYLDVKSRLDYTEGKKSLVKVEGIAQAVDEVFRSIGLGQKVKSVKSTGTWDKQYAVEEEAEVQVEKVTMNEMINIFYKIENGPMILAIKKAAMRTSFDSPTLLNVTMTLSLIKPK